MSEAAAAEKSVFVVGYTGESGKELVKALIGCDVINKLVLIGRREVTLEPNHSKIEQKVIDFDKIEECKASFEGCDVGFCCLGTTRGKSGKDGFIKVDHDYVVNTAKVAKETECKHFHLVSSTGADKNSWFLYPKVKGQVEDEIKAMDFDRYSVYRPALLMCDREESRPGEAVLRAIMKPITSLSRTLGNCPTSVLAHAMVNNTLHNSGKKVEFFNNGDIFKLAELSPDAIK